jgi:hypothetical protein
MPYKVVEREGKYDVVNTETDEVKATHDAKDDAERQVRLLHELEKDAEDEV